MNTLDPADPGTRYRHEGRGSTYRVIGTGTLQTVIPVGDNAPLVIYRSEATGDIYARPRAEFFGSGLFTRLTDYEGGEL